MIAVEEDRMRQVATVCLVLAAAGRAGACGGGYSNSKSDVNTGDALAILAGLAAPAIDLGFTIHDDVVEKSSRRAAVAELVLTAPPAIVLGAWALDNAGESNRS